MRTPGERESHDTTIEHEGEAAGRGSIRAGHSEDPAGAGAAAPRALKTATAAELKDQWRALFGKEPPPFNRPYHVSGLSYRVQDSRMAVLSRRNGRGSRAG